MLLGLAACTSQIPSTHRGAQGVAATHGSTTLVAEMWCETHTSGDAPFYIATDQSFDYVLTILPFQGS